MTITSGTTARAIAAGVRNGSLSAVDVVRAHLARIDSGDQRINAFAHVCRAEALRDAAAIDADSRRTTLPLAGVPVAIKENIAVAGAPTRHGSAATPERSAAADDPLVTRLRRAGAVIVGTTRMPELAAWAFTSSTAFGATRNPLDPTLEPGGSSGGSAAAVAAGMAAVAVGTDGGGSIRVPAAYCGVVGVKPTRALVPLPRGAREHWFGMTVTGPIARDAADAALALAVLADRPELAELPSVHSVRAVCSIHPASPVARPDRRQRASVARATELLAALGGSVTQGRPPYPMTLIQQWAAYWLAGIAQESQDLALDVADLEPRTAAMVARGNRIIRRGGPRRDDSWERRIVEWFGDTDVLVQPVTARSPGPAGVGIGAGYYRTYVAAARSVAFTQAWNLAGLPAVVVPVGMD